MDFVKSYELEEVRKAEVSEDCTIFCDECGNVVPKGTPVGYEVNDGTSTVFYEYDGYKELF
ncbi:MAG: hypothetical protein IE916_00170 [Epsilonproteobacteria bacterium]|nr:hypothetical protein [Campylobacterota bacterium]